MGALSFRMAGVRGFSTRVLPRVDMLQALGLALWQGAIRGLMNGVMSCTWAIP